LSWYAGRSECKAVAHLCRWRYCIQNLPANLIVEATDSGTMLREYVWLDDTLLAVFADLDTASPQLYDVHPLTSGTSPGASLNRPLRMTDGSRNE
jgi:hypothetical protein